MNEKLLTQERGQVNEMPSTQQRDLLTFSRGIRLVRFISLKIGGLNGERFDFYKN